MILRSALLRLAVLGLGIAVGYGCRKHDGDHPRNAVVFLLDTVRADHLSCYGAARATTPRIDALARDGVLFETAVSSSPWTKPSICSILAGTDPGHAIGKQGNLTRSLVESFQGAGRATAAFTEGGFFSHQMHMDKGFDTFVEEEGAVQALSPGEARERNAQGGIAHTFALARTWLADNKAKPFLLVIHTYEPHAPYTHTDFARSLDAGRIGPALTLEMVARIQAGLLELDAHEVDYVRALYDGDLCETDRHVGAFVDLLGELGLAQDTLIVVTSDHGEELGDHHLDHIGDHGHSLTDALLLVPLIIRDPHHRFSRPRVANQVRTLDILPTVAELCGVAIEAQFQGASLVPVLAGTEGGERAAISGWTSVGPASASLRAGGFKYIEQIAGAPAGRPMRHPPPACQLYDLAADPHELNNLCDTRPQLVAALHTALVEETEKLDLRHSIPATQSADQRLLDRLRSLGYVR